MKGAQPEEHGTRKRPLTPFQALIKKHEQYIYTPYKCLVTCKIIHYTSGNITKAEHEKKQK